MQYVERRKMGIKTRFRNTWRFSKNTSSEIAMGLTLDYSFGLFNQLTALIDDDFVIDKIVITGGGANEQIQTILGSLLKVPVELLETHVSVTNLFNTLSGEKVDNNLSSAGTKLDSETSEFLLQQSRNHALIYEQIEGTRKVLENVK
jgi:sugar (pentulose or hexulose) kinase